ncbi:MAG: membrane protein [Chloroflexi bacterium ADurb.Bin180]|nr:MAG: membrane protein [Chloroflexi bacterium ADurb.Bin180]
MPVSIGMDNRMTRRARSSGMRAHLFALAGLALLSVVLTYPLIIHLGSRIPGPPAPGDNLEYVYKVWWFKHALFELSPATPFFNPNAFYPFGYPVTLSETTLSNTIPALPLTLVFGEVVAYNLTLLASFILSALGMYLLVFGWTHSRSAAFVSGMIFAFCPYRLSHMGAGHLPLMGTQWLPFLLLFLDRMVTHGRRRDAVLAALFYVLGALSAWYYAYIYALAGLVFVLLRARLWRKLLFTRRFVIASVTFGVICLVLLGPLVWPVTRLWSQGSRPGSLKYVDSFSASPLDLVYPNVLQPLWGTALLRWYSQNPNENNLYLGLVPLLLTAVALVSVRRRRATSSSTGRQKDDGRRRLVSAIAWMTVVFLVLALGTTLHGKWGPLYIRVPASVERVFTAGMTLLTKHLALYPISSYSLRVEDHIFVPLPTLLLYLFLPFFNAMRVWTRMAIVSIAGVAILAGFGWAWLSGRIATARPDSRLATRVGLALAAGLIVLEFAAFPFALGMTTVSARPVDQWLATQPGDWSVMELPLSKGLSGRALYALRTHGKRTSTGYGTFFPQAFNEARPVLESFPSRESLELLQGWNVRYVLLGSRTYGQAWPALERACNDSPGLRYALAVEDEPVYSGDRVLRWLPGTEPAFLVDLIYVYEVL